MLNSGPPRVDDDRVTRSSGRRHREEPAGPPPFLPEPACPLKQNTRGLEWLATSRDSREQAALDGLPTHAIDHAASLEGDTPARPFTSAQHVAPVATLR
jgi:hypothetical protein